jgi:hypothetical protein
MADQSKRFDLEEVLSQALAGVIDEDFLTSWIQFKEDWSEDDEKYWKDLLKRTKRDREGIMILDPQIMSPEELSWAKDFINRAKKRGLC